MPLSRKEQLIQSETIRMFPPTVAYWEALRNARLFMTGATGLFGRWLLPAAIHANKELGLNLTLVLLTRNAAALRQSISLLQGAVGVQILEGDVKQFTFPESNFDYVIHGATTSAHETFHGETSLWKFNTLVDGTRHVLEFARRVGTKRVLFLSSGVVYGALSENMLSIPETFLGAPDTADHRTGLAQAKRAAEYLCAEYSHLYGFETKIARCFSFAGPGLPTDLHYAFGNFIHQALHNEKIVVQGDGTPLRSYLYLGDLSRWLLPLLTKTTSHLIYNVGSDHAVSISALAEIVRDTVAPLKAVEIVGRPAYSVGNSPRNIYVPDVSRMREEFAITAPTSLTDIVQLSADFERV